MSNAQQSGSLEEIVLTREQLEEIREVQEESKHSRGVGVLLIAYGEEIVPGKWIYFREHSPYVTEFLNIETFRTWIDGLHQFPLKHMKGLVDELGVSDEHLHYVAGRDPFTPTDEELERWSGIKEGIGKLFSHYINLNLGMFARQYLIKESEYVKGRELNPKTVMAGWFSGNCTFPVEHLKGFAEELGVPSDYVKRVTGVDIDEFKVLTWEDRLKEFRRVQEEKPDKGIGMLLENYIRSKGWNVASYINEHSEYAKREGLKLGTVRGGLNGNGTLALKHLRGIVRELRVSQVELEYVANRDPFMPTEEQWEEWSKDKNGLGNLFGFYIDLNLGLSRERYYISSEYIKKEGLISRIRNLFFRKQCFPLYHLKNLAEEVGVPIDYIKRVSGIDLSKVDSTREVMIAEFRRIENENPTRGIGLLIRNYIARQGFTVKEFINNHSEYLSKSGANAPALCQQVIGQRRFHLKHMKGLVDELRVLQEELKEVAGRNPFEPTDSELEEWSQEKNGIGKLLDFYIELRYAIPRRGFFRRSEYIKDNGVKIDTAASWFTKKFHLRHIKPLVDELRVPYEQVQKVSGVDLSEVKTAKDELAEAFERYVSE